MATSIGGAAADGLTQGFQIGLGIANQQKQQQRQEALDAQQTSQIQRNNSRQDDTTALQALDEQQKNMAAEGTALQAGNPTQAQQDDYAARSVGLQSARAAQLHKMGGLDLGAIHAQAATDLQTISANDLSALPPGGLTRAVTVATGQNPNVYMRGPNGQPSPIELAGQSVMEGMQNGDKNQVLQGANTLLAPRLSAGIGQPSPHGGTIVKKEIADLVPDPNSDPKDPTLIPVLKVYVDRGSGFTGPRIPGANGATSYYMAPMTEGASTDSKANTLSLNQKSAMDFVGQNLHVAELLNQPQGVAQMQIDQQSGAFDPNAYLQAQQTGGRTPDFTAALQRMGVQPQKLTTKTTVMPAGGSALQETQDASGRTVSSRLIQGNSKPDAAGVQRMNAALAQLEKDHDSGAVDDDQYQAQKASIIGGTRGAGGAGAANTVLNRQIGRQLQNLQGQQTAMAEKRKNAIAIYKTQMDNALSKADKAAVQKDFDAKNAALDTEAQGILDQRTKLQAKLDANDDDDDGSPAAAPAPASAQTPAAAASRAANRVSPATQAARDSDANTILQGEVPRVQAQIDAATKAGDQVALTRAQGDLAALQREAKKNGVTLGLGAAKPGSAAASAPAAAAAPRPASAASAGLGSAKAPAVLRFDRSGNLVR